MENTPLNKAHETGRRAIKLLRKGQLLEAAECHIKAANILQGLENTLDKDSLCKRSLEEQVKFHERQAELTEFLRKFVEKEGVKLRRMAENPKSFDQVENRKVFQPVVVKKPLPHPEIQRKFDEADSLLHVLKELQKAQSIDGMLIRPAVEFTIRPKNDAEVIEELQTVNSNLRALVDKLLNELNESREENRDLQQRLEIYEKRKSFPMAEYQRQSEIKESNIVSKVLETTEIIQVNTISRDFTEIPEFDPLEEPDFDFSEFSK